MISSVGKFAYAEPFSLELSDIQFIDDNESSILEPGERLYVSSIQVTNRGPMPSPSGQIIRFSLQESSTLLSPAPLEIPLDPIAAGTTVKLNFKKGQLTLQVPSKSSLLGH